MGWDRGIMAHLNFPVELAKYSISSCPSISPFSSGPVPEVHLLRREVAWLQQEDGAPQGLSIQHCRPTGQGLGKVSQQFR